MLKDAFTNNILYLIDSLLFTIDTKEKVIEDVYLSNYYLKDRVSYEEFPYILEKAFDLRLGFENKLIKFFYNLDFTDKTFSLSLNYLKKDESNITLNYKAYKYEKDKILTYVTTNSENTIKEVDELTKALNKSEIITYSNKSIEEKRDFAIMLFKIDDFETVNKKYGKVYGDILLIETVACIKKVIKNKGIISRISSSTFAIFLNVESDYNILHEACTDIRKQTKELSIHNVKQIEVTATVGSAVYPKDGDSFDILIRKAELALERGIKKGGNCFIIYSEERCGKPSLFMPAKFYQAKSDQYKVINLDANIIAGVIEILNRDDNFKKNVEDSISLLGNYFLLDRISFIRVDKKETIDDKIIWFNPSLKDKIVPNIDPIFRKTWLKSNDANGIFKINQISSNKDHPLYLLLKESNTTAILSLELEIGDKSLGTISFDMCTGNRFWQKNEISTLMLAARIIAIKLNKEIENELHYEQLYFDSETKTYNYNKWIKDVRLLLDSDNNKKYSLMQIGLVRYHNLKSSVGNNSIIKVLKIIVDKLKEYNDIIHCRETEDKFLLFINSTDKDYICHVFNDLSEHLNENNPIKRGDTMIYAGVYINECNDDINIALDKTELASKQQNSASSITFFSIELFEIQREKYMLEMHMKEALNNNEFLLFLQPKINSLTGELVGAEALTRWNFNHTKMIYPNVFIPLFEENGFIEELDYSVFENVCRFQRKLIDKNKIPVPISINVSRYVVDFKKYLEKLNSIRSKYNIPTNLIEVEITEGMYVNNDDIISGFINMLHQNGYKVSMDDFGAGYSNLSSLSNLDFDLIKLDKNFCKSQNDKDTIILSTIIEMMKKLNINILCEGVETESYAEYLKSIGCYIIQGYLYDKPLPEKAFEEKYITKFVS